MKFETGRRAAGATDGVTGAWIRLLKAHNLILREARTRLAERCSMPQFDILAQLAREKNGTPLIELSRRLLVTAGNITGIIDRMEKSGLVARKADPNDRRITRVHLTAKGKQLAKSIIPEHTRDLNSFFDSLNEKEIAQLRSLLDKLIEGLEHANAGNV